MSAARPILETPSPIAGAPPLSLKLEGLQHSGSFKARGAFHNLLTRPAPAAGCATASGGNHGAAVAFAAEALGVPARVFVPEISTPAKVARIRASGAEAVVGGADYAEAQARCDAYVAESGALKVPPLRRAGDRRRRRHGRARMGGGPRPARPCRRSTRCSSRSAAAASSPASPPGLPAASRWSASSRKGPGRSTRRFRPGRRSTSRSSRSPRTRSAPARVGALNLAIAQAFVARIALVPDAAIVEAQRRLWRDFAIVAEPGGAAAFAALLSGAYRPEKGERVGVLVCGANVDLAAFAALV